jgi:histidyl-tRNA synthetase
MAAPAARQLYDLVSVRRDTRETLDALSEYETCAQGLEELTRIVDAVRQFGVPDAAFCVDLGVVRGLDYYTGTIYETTLTQYPEIGSICSGGRYDDLASYFTDTRLPGVGISIGLTRLFSKLKEAGLLRPAIRSPAEALVTVMDGQFLDRYLKIARMLREAGVNTELYLEPARLTKQLEYADKKGFRVALIAGDREFGRDEVQVKNLFTKVSQTCRSDRVVETVKGALKDSQV